MIDPSTYNCEMVPEFIYNNGNLRTFEVGDKVNLINKAYFKNGRQSRVIGFEWPLDIPYDHPIYTVGVKSKVIMLVKPYNALILSINCL